MIYPASQQGQTHGILGKEGWRLTMKLFDTLEAVKFPPEEDMIFITVGIFATFAPPNIMVKKHRLPCLAPGFVGVGYLPQVL